MARVKRGVTSHAKHKKVLKAAKGFYGRRKNTIRTAKPAVDKSMQYAYRDRKNKKRTFRALWIQRLNAAVREQGMTYSRFIDGLGKAGVEVDRKVLSEMAIHEPAAFAAYVERAKARAARTGSGLRPSCALARYSQPRRLLPISSPRPPAPTAPHALPNAFFRGSGGLTRPRAAPAIKRLNLARDDDRSHPTRT